MKTLTTKLLAVTFIFALATGCASVTDPGLDTQEPNIEQPTHVDTPDLGTDQDMSPIVDRPE